MLTPGNLTPKRRFLTAAPSEEITQVMNATRLLTQLCPAHYAKLQNHGTLLLLLAGK